ncbi:MAG: dihydroorotase, partial [Chrysiogenales bacterium]
EKVTVNPARILKIDRGELRTGRPADVTVIDPEKRFVITNDFFLSKCKNSPFIGRELYGSVEYTICNGNVVYSGGK